MQNGNLKIMTYITLDLQNLDPDPFTTMEPKNMTPIFLFGKF